MTIWKNNQISKSFVFLGFKVIAVIKFQVKLSSKYKAFVGYYVNLL